MNVEIVSKYGSGIDTDVQRFWRDDGNLIVEYADGSEELYRHGEATAAVEDDGDLDDLHPRMA